MTAEEEIDIRVELATLHARLGEVELGVASLARAAELARDPSILQPALLALRAAAAGGSPPASVALGRLEQRISELERRGEPPAPSLAVPGLATSTLAELLERQGHRDSALETAEQVLARDPDDSRALALRERIRGSAPRSRRIERLEGWLERLQRRFAEGPSG